ncbi:RagB/SusD family nutrient uptake outer membrane protein [Olivibacter sp. SDN3]|uniref:RagB/SusD family nutrient uptake outer membrane protein n=1 Tax=Olivibacter sp. SDN3 TaxID=2764720 RepID=UPI0016512852|nr:RagB/SusD family nutrient uptake outer membrane protein [Olivibacter sp. SDN3]QNL48660.1 RagB/SusD family nutrient uptake outer membrane protein [Olivibacter sp. SDN3]
MKAFIKNILFLVTVFGLTNCSNFLDKEPLEALVDENFYQTEEDALRAINATYAPLASGAGPLMVNRIGDRMAGDTQTAETDDPLSLFTILPNNETATASWQNAYAGILRANLAINRLADAELDEELKSRLLGEAHFLRGLYYHYLAIIFGEVPLILTPSTDTDDYLVSRTPIDEIYRQIEQDLAFAEEQLPTNYTGADVGRATRGAAKAYLAKVHLYQEKWEEAAAKAAEVTDNAASFGYRLMDDYFHAFELENDNSPESIFEVQYASFLGGLGSILNDYDAPRASGFSPDGGYGQGTVRRAFVEHFAEGDPRLGFSVFMEGDVFQGITYNPAFTPTGFSTKKYIVGRGPNIEPSNSPKNFIMMRYAELLLIRAEALNEVGSTAEAVVYVNQIRQRPSVNMPTIATGISQNALREAIKLERHSELGLEGHFFFDLVRWGDAESYLYGIGRTNFRPGVHERLPIPQAEMDLNPNLTQNPGY